MEKILIVEDDKFLRDILKRYLENEGYQIFQAETGEIALELLSQQEFSLITLDIMLPGISGWELCQEIKRISSTPLIILTARGEEEDEVKGIELGADDYIEKPFKPKAFLARVKSLIKRNNQEAIEKIGDLEIDRLNYKIMKNGVNLNLGTKGYALLNYFITNKGLVLSRDKILDNVWSFEYDVDSRVVDTWVKILRKHIGENSIITVRGIGYKFSTNGE